MTDRLSAQKAALLALVGGHRPGQPGAALSAEDWAAIDAMAAQHRLQPWLYAQSRKGAITAPPALAAAWQDAYRHAAMGALTAQAALVRTQAALAAGGVAMVALKGSRLAFFDYPEAALRPMRDIDVLVAPDALPRAVAALADAGFEVPADRPAAIARALDGDKHLAPMAVPGCDRWLELHHRIAEPGLPCIATDAILAGARRETIGGREIAFPSPAHMLGHLVLHAVYNHRFDCGPLALVDIAMLLRGETIDPAAFATEAARGGWLPGARLVVALVDRVLGETGFAIGQHDVPEPILAHAEGLLLQDFDQREQVLFAAQSARQGLAATIVRRLRKGLGTRREEGRLRWFGSRTLRTIRQASDPRARGEAGAGAIVARWLVQAEGAD